MRNRDGCPRYVRPERLGRILNMRMNDAAQEIDVFRPQAARLGQAQPDERAEQHGEPDTVRKQVVEFPDLFSGCHIDPLLTQLRRCPP